MKVFKYYLILMKTKWVETILPIYFSEIFDFMSNFYCLPLSRGVAMLVFSPSNPTFKTAQLHINNKLLSKCSKNNLK